MASNRGITLNEKCWLTLLPSGSFSRAARLRWSWCWRAWRGRSAWWRPGPAPTPWTAPPSGSRQTRCWWCGRGARLAAPATPARGRYWAGRTWKLGFKRLCRQQACPLNSVHKWHNAYKYWFQPKRKRSNQEKAKGCGAKNVNYPYFPKHEIDFENLKSSHSPEAEVVNSISVHWFFT